MASSLKETALRLLERNIVTWLRDNSYQQLRRNAKEATTYPDGVDGVKLPQNGNLHELY